MSLTDSQIQELIILRVGDVDASGNPTVASTGVLATNIVNIWSQYSGRLQALYTERDCIDIVLGRIRGRAYDVKNGKTEAKRSQLAQTLLDMKKAINARINSVLLSQQFASGTPMIGEITTVTPVAEEDQVEFIANIR